MRISVIVTWPIHIDYPLWRSFISLNRSFFYEVIVAFSDHHMGYSIEKELTSELSQMGAITVPSVAVEQGDWRHNAVSRAYSKATGDVLWFTEQDFMVHAPDVFFPVVYDHLNDGVEFIYYQQQGRIHPACMFVASDAAQQTSRDFSARPGIYDHFYQFATHVDMSVIKAWSLEDLFSGEEGKMYSHMNGLTNNYDRALQENFEFYMPEQFLKYNKDIEPLLMKQDNPFNELVKKINEL